MLKVRFQILKDLFVSCYKSKAILLSEASVSDTAKERPLCRHSGPQQILIHSLYVHHCKICDT